MFRTFGHFLIACAMFAVVGGHWAVLQTVAWTGMIVENVQKSSFSEALRDTFSGEKPCHLCHVIQEAREQEKHLPVVLTADKKIDKFLPFSQVALQAPAPKSFSYAPVVEAAFDARPLDPPFHVPIAA